MLDRVIQSIEAYDRFVEGEIDRARRDPAFAADLRRQWQEIRRRIPTTTTPTGLTLPRLALPPTDEPAEIARYLFGEGLPGSFPFVNAIYPEMYLEKPTSIDGNGRESRAGDGPALPTNPLPHSTHTGNGKTNVVEAEEPTRLFAGLGLADDTNRRFHFLTGQQRTIRLSTAFDGPTLYGMDSDEPDLLGKIGEGGVAIDTLDDMVRLYAGFPLGDPHVSVSMTINGPAPVLLAMYVAAAVKQFGPDVLPKLRGTVQADILKEVQAQNEVLFPLDASLRLLTDMVEYTTRHMPRWYPISISGYHIAEAGATPVQQAAYTLSNGFTYVQLFRERGLDVNVFGPRLSFFLDGGLDVEYLALARVCRKIWAVGMRDAFAADDKAQRFKLHTQTSGRSLVSADFRNNLTRTAIELTLACANATNSCHSNSADEPFTTPSAEYVRLAAHAQAILLEESGLFKHMMNTLSGSPGMKVVEQAVESAILEEFRQIDRLGGVLQAVEHRYQRSQIQSAAHRYENQIYAGVRPIIGLNRYRAANGESAGVEVVRTPRKKQLQQAERLAKFKKKHARHAEQTLDELTAVIEKGGNTFEKLIETVEHCSLGQITRRLQEVVGHYRPMV